MIFTSGLFTIYTTTVFEHLLRRFLPVVFLKTVVVGAQHRGCILKRPRVKTVVVGAQNRGCVFKEIFADFVAKIKIRKKIRKKI